MNGPLCILIGQKYKKLEIWRPGKLEMASALEATENEMEIRKFSGKLMKPLKNMAVSYKILRVMEPSIFL